MEKHSGFQFAAQILCEQLFYSKILQYGVGQLLTVPFGISFVIWYVSPAHT